MGILKRDKSSLVIRDSSEHVKKIGDFGRLIVSIFRPGLDDRSVIKIISSIMFVIFVVFCSVMMLVDGDLWDGVIVQHAIAVGSPEVYREWFLEAGLFLTPYIYDFLSFIGGDNYAFVARLVSLVFLAFSAREIYFISRRIFEADVSISVLAAGYFLLSPAWVLYYSSIYVMHSITLFLALLSARLLINKKHVVLALMLAVLSFQQSSNAVLVISLLFLSMGVCDNWKEKIPLYGFAASVLIIAFFGLRLVFPTSGLYVDYNKIDISSIFFLDGWLRFVKAFVWVNHFIVLAAVVAVAGLFFHRRWRSNALVFVMVGAFVNFLPYIAVSKYPSVGEIGMPHGNSLRFTFTVTVFAALLIPALYLAALNLRRLMMTHSDGAYARTSAYIPDPIKVRHEVNKKYIFGGWGILYGLLICAASVYLFVSAHKGKVQEFIYQREFASQLRKFPEASACVVNVVSKGAAYLTVYEYGDIFYRAFGENDSLVLANSDNVERDVASFVELQKKETYRIKYFLPTRMPDCRMSIEANSDILTWSFFRTYTELLFPSGMGNGGVRLLRL